MRLAWICSRRGIWAGSTRSCFWLKYRTLDAAATELLVASPQIQHRLDVTENATADVDVLARLARDPEPRVRFVYAVMLFEYKRRIPAGVLEILAQDLEPKIRRIVGESEKPPVAVQEPPPVLMAEQRVTHPDPAVRMKAAADPEVPTVLAPEIVPGSRPTCRAISRTPFPWAFRRAISSRSANDRYLPECGFGSNGRMPPHCRYQRFASAGATPIAPAASSARRPSAIASQNAASM